VVDDYATLLTTDAAVAEEYGFERVERDWDDGACEDEEFAGDGEYEDGEDGDHGPSS
jgi:hypothetical protein